MERLAEARLVTVTNAPSRLHTRRDRHWPTLRAWLDEDREGRRIHRRLTEAAQEWHILGREQSALYRGARSAAATEWADANPGELNEQERAFPARGAAASSAGGRRIAAPGGGARRRRSPRAERPRALTEARRRRSTAPPRRRRRSSGEESIAERGGPTTERVGEDEMAAAARARSKVVSLLLIRRRL